MVLADTIGILLIVLGTLAATSMLWLFHLALWPDVVEEAGMKFTHSPIKSFFCRVALSDSDHSSCGCAF